MIENNNTSIIILCESWREIDPSCVLVIAIGWHKKFRCSNKARVIKEQTDDRRTCFFTLACVSFPFNFRQQSVCVCCVCALCSNNLQCFLLLLPFFSCCRFMCVYRYVLCTASDINNIETN